ncbi:Ger(x)C family spore germination protein [Candidatus Formimonas warabiya]|uniref:Ger(X)C family spore germination protein n=1 Tax=Formimonas warabiya TaxID=1761012 RepID=A0A3G1KLV2_FORW1|nr:Ger(x)C family spore germination protein [Candidatus Formimonas warabiya]ATW23400.1 hypothetical protein DCMF_00070 [Candidatus Formimonas warabiya]
MFHLKKVGAVFLLCLLTTGCWSRNEVEDLAIVSAIGIDQVQQGDAKKIQFSVLVVKPERSSGGSPIGAGTAGGVPGWINFGEGNSVFDAQRNLSTTTPRRIFLGHSRVIILGEETARNGVGDIIDYLERDKDIRLRNWVVVSKSSALQTLTLDPVLENLFSDEVNDLLTLSAPRVSKTYAVDLKDFLVDLASPGKEAVLPLLEVREIPKEVSLESQQGGQTRSTKNIRLEGLAVFYEDKMVGELKERETKGFLWVIGQAKTGTLTFSVPNKGTKKPVQVTVEMTRAKSQIKTKILNGKPDISVKIVAEGNLGEFSDPEASIKPEDIAFINKAYAAQIKEEAEMALAKCQNEFQSDIFGFGSIFHRQHAKYWAQYQLEKNWTKIFPEVPVKVEVQANIRRTGLTSDSISIE